MAKKKAAMWKRRALPKRRFSNLVPGEMPPNWRQRFDPILREIVFVSGRPADTDDWFSLFLTRVPCVGEEIGIEAECYRVVRVTHMPVGYDGRARLGNHALIEVELVPEPK